MKAPRLRMYNIGSLPLTRSVVSNMAHFATLTGLAAHDAFLKTVGKIGIKQIKDVPDVIFEAIFGMAVSHPEVMTMIAELRLLRDPNYDITAALLMLSDALKSGQFTSYMKVIPGTLFTTKTLHNSEFECSKYLGLWKQIESLQIDKRTEYLPQILESWIEDMQQGFAPTDLKDAILSVGDRNEDYYTPERVYHLLVKYNLLDQARAIPEEMQQLPSSRFLRKVLAVKPHFSTLESLAAYNAFLKVVTDIGFRELRKMSEIIFEAIFGMSVTEPEVKMMIAELRYMRYRDFDIKAVHEDLKDEIGIFSDSWMNVRPGTLFTTKTLRNSDFRKSHYLSLLEERLSSKDKEYTIKDVLGAWIADMQCGFAPICIVGAACQVDCQLQFDTAEEWRQTLRENGLWEQARKIPQEMIDLPVSSFLKQILEL